MFFQESFFPSKRARKCPVISTWVFGVSEVLAINSMHNSARFYTVEGPWMGFPTGILLTPFFTSILYIFRFFIRLLSWFLFIFFTFMKGVRVYHKKNYLWYMFDDILGSVLISLGCFERIRNLPAICFDLMTGNSIWPLKDVKSNWNQNLSVQERIISFSCIFHKNSWFDLRAVGRNELCR